MKKLGLITLLSLCAVGLFANPATEIAQAGDTKWNDLVSSYKSANLWLETLPTEKIVEDFSSYKGKVMLFPRINFGDFITDQNGDKYYWYGEKGTDSFYLIKYDSRIQDQLLRLNNALGNVKGDYEVMGRLTDTWTSWGNVVLMNLVAMRVKDRACVVMVKDKPVLVGEEILTKWLASKATSWSEGIPTDAKAVPKDLSAEQVAKWFLYYGSVKKNPDMWVQLCTVEDGATDAQENLTDEGQSWWDMISQTHRQYYFVRPNPDRGDATHVYFMYQIKIDGQDVGSPKPMSVLKESTGQWRVDSF